MTDIVTDFVRSLNFVLPLFFESNQTDFPYYCGGTCFLATYRGQRYLLTARHCIEGHPGDPCILGPTNQAIPIKQNVSLVATSENDKWTDLCCFTTYESKRWPPLKGNNFINIDDLCSKHISADSMSPMVVKGYPHFLTDIELPKICRKPCLQIGFYGGQATEKHCHIFDNIYPSIIEPNGLSGSPAIKIDSISGGACFPTLLGIVVQGGTNCQQLRFIGVDIIIKMLIKISQRN